MKIEAIEILDFRQFAGKNRIEFSTDNKKNLTIIHALNGSGKTTLLQAFNWCLYGDLKLPNKNKLLNETVLNNSELNSTHNVSVKLEVSHREPVNGEEIEMKYTIERSITVKKDSSNSSRTTGSEFKINYKDILGNDKIAKDSEAENIINQILPAKLSQYFLFDGERIKNLGENNASARKDIAQGIKNILKIDVYDSLKIMLEKKVLISFEGRLKEKGGSELQDKINKKTDLVFQIETDEKIIEQLEKDIEQFKLDIGKLDDKIRLNSTALEFENEYKAKKETKSKLEWQLKALLNPGKSINQQSFPKIYTSYTMGRLLTTLKDEVLLNLDMSKINDDVIIGVNAEAIDKIIDNNKCICGRKIGHSEMQILSDLKQYLPPHDHKVLIHGFKEKYLEKISKFDETVIEKDEIFNKFFELSEEVMRLGEQIKALGNKLSTNTDIGELHTLRTELENAKDYKISEKAILKEKYLGLNKKLDDVQIEIDNLTRQQEVNKEIRENIEFTKDLVKILNNTISKKKTSIHQQLNIEVNRIFTSAAHKKSKEVVIDEEYNYKIRDKNTGSEALSEGESIITSLSLIAAIVKIAKDQYKNKNNQLEASAEYPLILDAPFAKLDTTHISGIAPLLPEFSDQVILFSIDQQFKGAVEQSVAEYIGKQYEMRNFEDTRVEFKEL